MCGIPSAPPVVPDAVKGRRLTFEQAVAHIGGEDNLVSEHGHFLIKQNLKQFLWKYPDKTTYCTACNNPIEGFLGKHGSFYSCPVCGERCEFRHVARGFKRVYDEFYLYEWRRSALDPETVVLTGATVCRRFNRYDRPHEAPVYIEPSALYVFRPGKAVTVYKQRWYWTDNYNKGHWERMDCVCPEHTNHGARCEIVVDNLEFRRAIEGTRIGATFDALREESGAWMTLELDAIANCARRPYLEYLYKSGQRTLAAQLMRRQTVPRDIIPRPKAKKRCELMGLTEGQWYETRRDVIQLTEDMLECLHVLGRVTGKPAKVCDVAMLCKYDPNAAWSVREFLPEGRPFHSPTVGNYIQGLPDKLRRRIVRRLLEDFRNLRDWRDYYAQLQRLGEDMTDPALLLPRDMPAMHQRMTERENAIKEEARIAKMDAYQAILNKRMVKLRRDYTFTAAGLILRPYESAREIVEEGKRLKICIGSYAESYMKGVTVICCLRRAEEPDEPWRAVEFSPVTGKLVQDRGYKNDMQNGIPPGVRAQLRNFWSAWDRAHGKRRKTA